MTRFPIRLLALTIALLMCGAQAFAATPSPTHHGSTQHPTTEHTTGQRTTHTSRDRQPGPKSPVGVTIGSVQPKGYLRAASTLRLRGQITNQSQSTYQRVSVQLRFSSRRMTTRGEVDAYSDGKGPDPQQGGRARVVAETLPVGGQQSWKLSMPVRQMGLTTFGVYPVTVEVFSAAGALLGHQRTFVTYYPTGSIVQRTKIAWVWPLIDEPHRASDTTFVDDRLERGLGSGGRLSTIVSAAAHTSTPVSWLIDPSLVDDASKMADTNGYSIKGDADRPQSVAALDWLRSLHSAVVGDHLIATPYADPDVMALADRRMSGDVRLATQEGQRALANARFSGATGSVAMPPNGLADQAALSALASAGARTVLLSSAVLPDSKLETFTPNPVVNKTIAGNDVKLVAYDDTIRKILSADTSDQGGTVLAEQRFLAETAMITDEAPQNPRTIVITPPRRWDPSPTFAKGVLDLSAKAPWLQPVQLSDAETLRSSGRTFQPSKSGSGLSKHYLGQVKQLSSRVRVFTSIFVPPTSDFTLGVARTESSAWNGQSVRAKALYTALEKELGVAVGKIKVLNDGDTSTMVGNSGRIPITISNGLDHGTVAVTLHVYSQNDTRLRVNSVDRTLVLEPGHKDQVTLDMKAAANGPAYVYIELWAPNRRAFGGAHVLHVNATGYGRTALLITGISLAVLFVGVVYRIMRRRAERAEESVD